MSSQQQQQQPPLFYIGGQVPNQYARAPPPANGVPMTPSNQQQMAFQQNAALPGMDLSALKGISAEQLMAIARLMQSGQITLPPPASGADSTPDALPVSAPSSRLAAAQQASASLGILGGDDVDMDKEEGELEDDLQLPRAHARSPSMTERGAQSQTARTNSTPHARSFIGAQNGAQSSNDVAARTKSVPEPIGGAFLPSMAVKAFVLELHRVGYGFENLAREVGNKQALRKLYKQIGLPLQSVSSAPPVAVQQSILHRTATNNAPAVDETPMKAVAESQTPKQPAAAASVKTPAPTNAKPDRASYLAKLQAAKSKKSESAVGSPTGVPTKTPAVSASMPPDTYPSIVSQGTPQPAARQPPSAFQAAFAAVPQPNVSTAPPPSSTGAARPAKVTVDTKLVRQRLAKLQAERAAAQKTRTDNTQQSHLSSNNAAQPQQNATVPAAESTRALSSPVTIDRSYANGPSVPLSNVVSPSLARGSGLPGLFTTRTSVQQSSSPAPPPPEASATVPLGMPTHSPAYSPESFNLPRQRSANSERALWNGSSVPRGVFGERRLQNEAFIIETSSDDDDGGEDMEIDESTGHKSPEPETKSLPARPVGYLVEVSSSRFDSQKSASTPGTPGIDLKRKLEEIEVAKQQLEEMKRRKVVNKPASSMQAATFESPIAALTARSSTSVSDHTTLNAELGNNSPYAAANSSKQQQKEALRKRLQELQDSLPHKNPPAALDAVLPTSEVDTQSTPGSPEDQSSGAADQDDDDTDDLYEPVPASKMEASVSMDRVEIEHLEDDDGEIYEPQSLVTTANGAMGTQISTKDNKIGSQATTHSGTADGEKANTQLNSEMNAPMAHVVDGNGPEVIKPAPPMQLRTNPNELVQDLKEDGIGIEEGELVDDESDNMYEPSTDDKLTTANPSQESATSNMAVPADVLNTEQDEEEDDGNQSMDISDDSDSSSDSESGSSDESSDDYEPEHDIVQEPLVLPGSPEAAEEHQNDDPVEPRSSSDKDNLTPELQPPAKQDMAVAESVPTGFYKPYISVLSRFKEFRYHPSFIDTVSGGHKSLTYSNKIDPDQPICPFEIGGRCNDKDCQFQHFSTNNDLLREIGTRKIPVKDTEEEKKKWRDGMAAVVQELRSTNRGKDVAVIAQRIAEFRREFRGDPTKTLLLD